MHRIYQPKADVERFSLPRKGNDRGINSEDFHNRLRYLSEQF